MPDDQHTDDHDQTDGTDDRDARNARDESTAETVPSDPETEPEPEPDASANAADRPNPDTTAEAAPDDRDVVVPTGVAERVENDEYEDATVDEIKQAVEGAIHAGSLGEGGLRALYDYEAANANRTTLLSWLDTRIENAPTDADADADADDRESPRADVDDRDQQRDRDRDQQATADRASADASGDQRPADAQQTDGQTVDADVTDGDPDVYDEGDAGTAPEPDPETGSGTETETHARAAGAEQDGDAIPGRQETTTVTVQYNNTGYAGGVWFDDRGTKEVEWSPRIERALRRRELELVAVDDESQIPDELLALMR